MKMKIFCFSCLLLFQFNTCFAIQEVINISVKEESENKLILLVEHTENKFDYKQLNEENKAIIIIRDAEYLYGNGKLETKNNIAESILWSSHKKDKKLSVWLVIKFFKKPSVKIVTMGKRTLVILAHQSTKSNFALLTEKKGGVLKYIWGYGPIPTQLRNKMTGISFFENCPVPLNKLSYLVITFLGFDNKPHKGELIVHNQIASEVIEIFMQLYNVRFKIEKMKLITQYDGKDSLSMSDNNTSAFNCRKVTGNDKVYSKHSYGLAIDINPLINPYVKNKVVHPSGGLKYSNRKNKTMGMITKSGKIYAIFKSKGWLWGGDWKSIKDYQHFEKK
ncbi:MAG: M15 family metallopeptidase [Deltaproteobacteria bacterium]|nr:M15 family metallopeptidase [Deltaproteobacteria bacterium]